MVPQNNGRYRVIEIVGNRVRLNWESDDLGTYRIEVLLTDEDSDVLETFTGLYERGELLAIYKPVSDMHSNDDYLDEIRKAVTFHRENNPSS